ncbi:Teichoic acid linkage unit synthesis [Bacillaceae bacterium ZC4]|nr:Teichoic acid linkage unit synthesis [Bacillaceae bacterium ZC4]
MEIPPILGTAFLWTFLLSGISTAPILRANLITNGTEIVLTINVIKNVVM